MRKLVYIGIILVQVMTACKKEEIQTPTQVKTNAVVIENTSRLLGKNPMNKDQVVMIDYLNMFNRTDWVNQRENAYNLNTGDSNNFTFTDYRKEGKGVLEMVMGLEHKAQVFTLQTLLNNIVIGKRNAAIFNAINERGDTVTYATNANIVFTAYQYPGRIEGYFEAFTDTAQWTTGRFAFTVTDGIAF